MKVSKTKLAKMVQARLAKYLKAVQDCYRKDIADDLRNREKQLKEMIEGVPAARKQVADAKALLAKFDKTKEVPADDYAWRRIMRPDDNRLNRMQNKIELAEDAFVDVTDAELSALS